VRCEHIESTNQNLAVEPVLKKQQSTKPIRKAYSSMSCQIVLRTTAAQATCGLPTFALCSKCRNEICISCMAICCTMSFCAACERDHIMTKHHGYRCRPVMRVEAIL
jgi:hypothetical protein